MLLECCFTFTTKLGQAVVIIDFKIVLNAIQKFASRMQTTEITRDRKTASVTEIVKIIKLMDDATAEIRGP